MDLGPDQLLAGHSEAALPRRMEYMLLRAHTAGLKPLVDKLDAKDKPVWERKLRLLGDAEREIKAKERYDQISKIVEAKDWKQVEPQVTDFQKTFGNSEVAQENAATINGWLAQAAKELTPANPWKKVFHCTASRDLPDGSIELYYDFAKTPEAAADFSSNPGQPVVGDQHLVVEKGDEGKGFEQLFFNVPILELRLISLTMKVAVHRKGGCRIGFQPPEAGAGINSIVDLNPKAGIALQNPIGDRKKYDWGEMNFGDDTDFSGKMIDAKTFNWTLAGKDLGNSATPELHGARFAIGAFLIHNCWSKFKIVFKPDLKWLNDHTDATQKDHGERQPKPDK
jgi:hypothetical protein